MLNRLTIILFFTASSAFAQDKGMFIVNRDYRIRPFPEASTIVLDWAQLKNHASIPEQGDFDITDGNFGKRLTKKLIDDNNDGQPDRVVIEYVFQSDEALYSFSLTPNGKAIALSTSNATADTRLKITYLKKPGNDITNWPDKIIESTMLFYPNASTLGGFNYESGFFLNAMFARWQETKNPAYLPYIKKWADRFIDTHGYINPKYYNVSDYRLEDLLPGRIFISLYEVTNDSRYKSAAQQLRQQLQYQPRTSDGGYWHMQTAPYQMWLDDVYTGGMFLMQYAKVFNEPNLLKEAMQQIKLVQEHNADPEKELLYHGWDESGNPTWANEDTGTSHEFWSRGIAWYYLALLDGIDYVPLEDISRKELGMMFRELTKPIQKLEDPKTGLWYQVTNKSYEPRNWIETSASAMFAYGFAKGFNKGILDKTYLSAAQKVFVSLQRDYIFIDDEGRVYFDGTAKTVTLNTKVSKGDLDYYVSTERRVNDYKGLGALLYLSMELD
jgi:unsaturated rhamnogalacturonyl hydrolase